MEHYTKSSTILVFSTLLLHVDNNYFVCFDFVMENNLATCMD